MPALPRLPGWAKGGALVLSGLAVAALVAVGFGKIAVTFGVYDLTRDAGFADHHPPPPDPRSEAELESLRRFPRGATALQPLIDATPTGGVLHLAPGIYAAPGIVGRPLRIEGEPGAVIDGGGVGSIMTVAADDVQVIGLTFRNSGERHESTDSALRLRGKHGIFRDNVIEDCLFGFELKQSDMNIIRRNRISSKDLPEALRGDAVRVWYSNGNRIEDNDIVRTRDTVVWYSKENTIDGNRIRDSRYGVHLMYAHQNNLRRNVLVANTVGVFLMYANDNVLADNVIHYSQGPSGIGIGFKESSGARIEHNDVFANARGLFMDASPYDPDSPNLFAANRFAYNGVAIAFHSGWEGNTFKDNAFLGNHAQAMVAGGGSAQRNVWAGNFWDSYDGFDRNHDGVGDTPYRIWTWADRLWMDVPDAQFFRAAPSLEMIDLVERLGSLMEPRLVLSDPLPRVGAVAAAGPRGVAVREVLQ
ncbi:nitrous oxide reductase family maturation protein NosD [Bradyrhizobium sp.]|uniref:nitrous oxide reductase family maturation protein NosD n=1 Tax=Bradyrhizobium sp. TaxID=376 RepID=UPI00238220E8|nr:nitrous oxide reductase family maturation protein NosD [Bradyrhizobium sp.]MDE2375764.1 nitrous oxide reductase family maturation protein NosD [Bradyrhizobium sp.]